MTYPQYHDVDDLKARGQLVVGGWHGAEEWLVCWEDAELGGGKKQGAVRVEVVYVVMKTGETFSGRFRVEGGRLVDRKTKSSDGAATTCDAEGMDVARLDVWDFPPSMAFYMLHRNEVYKGLRVRTSLHVPRKELKHVIWLHQHLQEHGHAIPSFLLQKYVREAYECMGKVKKGNVTSALLKVHQGFKGEIEAELAKVEALEKRIREREAAAKEKSENIADDTTPSKADLFLDDIFALPPVSAPLLTASVAPIDTPLSPLISTSDRAHTWECFPP